MILSKKRLPREAILKRRRQSLDNALANLRIEGLTADSRGLAELEKYVAGKISIDDAIRNFRQILSNGEIPRNRYLLR